MKDYVSERVRASGLTGWDATMFGFVVSWLRRRGFYVAKWPERGRVEPPFVDPQQMPLPGVRDE